jgi:RNA polymerase primary sigma factor
MGLKELEKRRTAAMQRSRDLEGLVRPEREDRRDYLARQAQKKDVYALRDLIVDLEPVIGAIAKRQQGQGIGKEELMYVSWVAVWRAVQKWQGRGRFSSYARDVIHGLVRRYIEDHGRTIRIPAYRAQKNGIEKKTREALTQRLGRVPTDEEVAAEMGVSLREVHRLVAESEQLASVDKMMTPEDEDNPKPTIEEMRYLTDPTGDPEKLVIARLMKEQLLGELNRAVKVLDREDLFILYLRHGLGRSRKYIERVMNLTPSAVRHREKRAREALKKDKKLLNSWIFFQD